MNIDKFGRVAGAASRKCARGRDGVGFTLTSRGHYDLKNRRLTRVMGPANLDDVATKRFVEITSKETEKLAIKTVAGTIRDYALGINQELASLKTQYNDIQAVVTRITTEYKNIEELLASKSIGSVIPKGDVVEPVVQKKGAPISQKTGSPIIPRGITVEQKKVAPRAPLVQKKIDPRGFVEDPFVRKKVGPGSGRGRLEGGVAQKKVGPAKGLVEGSSKKLDPIVSRGLAEEI